MTYELTLLENLILSNLPTPPEKDLVKKLALENDRIRVALLDAICGGDPEDVIRRQMRMHQQALLELADMLKGLNTIHKELKIKSLRQLFTILESLLKDYWDADEIMPWFERQSIRENILNRQGDLVNKLNKSGADRQLIGLMLTFKAGFLVEGTPFTYRQWSQVRELVAVVEELPGKQVKGATDLIIDHLFRLQISNDPLFSYIQDKTQRALKGIKNQGDHLAYLEDLLGHATNIVQFRRRQMPPEPGSLLARYIEWLRKMVQMIEPRQDRSPEETAGELTPADKIITSLSKPELGLMIRLFLETGIFKNDNWKGIARFMVAMVKTRNDAPGKTASSDYLHQLFYKVPTQTYTAVDQILDNMKKELADLRINPQKRRPE